MDIGFHVGTLSWALVARVIHRIQRTYQKYGAPGLPFFLKLLREAPFDKDSPKFWLVAKEFRLDYHDPETILLGIYPYTSL